MNRPARPYGRLQGSAYELVRTRLSLDFLRSRRGRGRRSDFDGIERFCLFIGHPRSGHTLVGALLNAHPNLVISQELDVLRYARAGYSRNQLYWLILDRDQAFTDSGSVWVGYEYAVPGQWQGRFTDLQVIGDKKGGASTRRLAANLELLDQLDGRLGLPVQYVHVVRDPLDNIATMSRRAGGSLRPAVEAYFDLCQTIARIYDTVGRERVATVILEEFVADPASQLAGLVGWLGVEAPDAYLTACARVVFDAPHRTRSDIDWPAGVQDEVMERMAAFPWLAGYPTDR